MAFFSLSLSSKSSFQKVCLKCGASEKGYHIHQIRRKKHKNVWIKINIKSILRFISKTRNFSEWNEIRKIWKDTNKYFWWIFCMNWKLQQQQRLFHKSFALSNRMAWNIFQTIFLNNQQSQKRNYFVPLCWQNERKGRRNKYVE